MSVLSGRLHRAQPARCCFGFYFSAFSGKVFMWESEGKAEFGETKVKFSRNYGRGCLR